MPSPIVHDRPSTPIQYLEHTHPNTPSDPNTSSHPNTPASHWSLSAPSTPHHEHSQQMPNATSPFLLQAQRHPRVVSLVPAHTLIRRRPLHQFRYERPALIELPEGTLADLRALEYVSTVDENLICPICRVAFINPVTTTCDHVFCRDCFDQSYEVSPTCPVDRCPLSAAQDIGPTHRLILNQLDGLEVRCPNTSGGCQQVLARSMVQNHVEKYCGHALVSCPEQTCYGKVPRKDISSGCLHYSSICPDCAESITQVDMPQHRAKECTERKVSCEKCGIEILRCQADEHDNSCEEAEDACKWAKYGCTYRSRRKNLPDHFPSCDFKVMGPVVESLKAEITTLRSEVQFLHEKDKSKDRRIKFLESDRTLGAGSSNELGYPVPDMAGLPENAPSSIEYAPFDSRDQYLLSLLESQETKVDQISLSMTELEAKQTMMLFNETISIKEQLAELRSAQGVLGMHVRWLMNFRLQERRPGAAGPSNESKSVASGQDFQSMRRSSDTMRELITKL